MQSNSTPENATELIVSIAVFASNPELQLIISAFNSVLIIFVIFVSFKIDKSEMSRLFTLWLFVIHAAKDIAQIVVSVLQLTGTVDSSGMFAINRFIVVPMIGKLFQDIASHIYRVLALFMVTMTYASYRFPMHFQNVLHESKRNRLFILGFIYILLLSIVSNVVTVVPHITEDDRTIQAFSALYVLLQILAIAPIVLLMLLYALSLAAIVKHSQQATNKESVAIHRRQLLSTLLYSTSPNLLLLPVLVGNICFIVVAFMPGLDEHPGHPIIAAAGIIGEINLYCVYLRIPVITVSTFLAFSSYRKVLQSWPFWPRKVKVIKVESSAVLRT